MKRKEWGLIVRDTIWKASAFLEELIRYAGMKLFLAPAARLLPRRLAMSAADCLSLLLLFLPNLGVVTYWDFRRVFRRSRFDSLVLTWKWFARPFRDYINFKRLLLRHEDLSRKRIIEHNTDGVDKLRNSDSSYVVATAHFTREALFALYDPTVTKGCALGLSHLPKERSKSLQEQRIRLQLETFIKASACWGKSHEIVPVGTEYFPFSKVCRRLQKPGTVVIIHVDAPWARRQYQTGWYERPFAAQGNRIFATGAADLARFAGCPVVSCAYSIEDDGTIALHWGSPTLPKNDECKANIEIMDRLIDELEIAIGKRPEQYVLPIGRDRLWNADQKRWEDCRPIASHPFSRTPGGTECPPRLKEQLTVVRAEP